MSKTNNGRGWWFLFEDGYEMWALGMSAQEKKIEVRNHGKLIRKISA